MAREASGERVVTRPSTMQDVAKRAGTSTTTVSHMLSGRRSVSAETQQRIQAAIDELGFRPNETARALRTQRTDVVAMILGNIAHEANPQVARGAGEVLRAADRTLAIYETNSDDHSLAEVLRALSSRRVDGAIVLLQGARSDTFDVLIEQGVAVVYAGPPNDTWSDSQSVYIDEASGIAEATRHVLMRTDGQVVYIGGPEGDPNAVARRDAFQAAMLAANRPLDVRQMVASSWSHAGGRAAMEKLLAQGLAPRGVVCANDLIAFGAIACAKEHGYAVPHDLVVTGFDNIEASGMVDPPLTTVEPHETELGRLAATAVLKLLAEGNDRGGDELRVVSPQLVIRQSAP